jgi:indolepyruvate ferredoxin oxidoreductase alpha subunit
VPSHGALRHVFVEERTVRLRAFAEEFAGNRIEPGDPDLGIIASGVAYQHAREAFPGASFLKLAMTWPLPEALIHRFAAGVRQVVVVEELDPFIEEQVRAMGVPVSGKDLLPVIGEYTPGLLLRALGGKPDRSAATVAPVEVPPRPPILCPGCPHRGVFHLLGKGGWFVTGDIGCYTLAALPPLSALHTCLCMGAGIGQALGIEKALGARPEKVAAVIGDSTFFHSGITPLLDVVHNGGSTVVIVLDNRTTAMTGRQDNPGTDRNIRGEEARRVDIAALARAVGIETVIETDAFDLDGLAAALKRAAEADGPVVIVNRGPCVLLTRQGARPLTASPAVCTGCRACLAVACPALGWSPGAANARGKQGASVIDPALCNGCGVCAAVCRFDAIGRIEP